MPPCKKMRNCRKLGGNKGFKPIGVPLFDIEQVILEHDEFEAVRLCDLEGKNQIEASESMGISRGTVQRVLLSGRYKIADALLNDKIIILQEEGGSHEYN